MDIDKTKITKGPVEVDRDPYDDGHEVYAYDTADRRFTIADVDERFTGEDGESQANALLIADAFNTFTATGLTPSELAGIIRAAANLIETGDDREALRTILLALPDDAALTKATEASKR